MKKGILAVLLTGAFAVSMMAGCGSSSSSSSNSSAAASSSAATETAAASSTTAESVEATSDAAASVDDAGGFTEYPIWEGADLGDLATMNGVYFQAVPMTGGYEDISDYNIHIEADISAKENTLGFGKGDWIPYLQVAYTITDASSGDEVVSGNFMPMSASDGPHYGANIKLDPGTYNFTVSVSPQEDVYLIHTDSETGPGGTWDDYFADGALTYTCENWEFAGLEQ